MRWDGETMPIIETGDDFMECARLLAPNYEGEFALYPSISPEAIEASILAGFMPMAAALDLGDGQAAWLTPKLHLDRCILDPALTRVTRTARRESSRYRFSVNHAFQAVMDSCIEEHGPDWLIPELAQAFAQLHSERRGRRVAFLSVELWDSKDEFHGPVAGEIGYLVGSAFVSLTGFRKASGAGTVQLAALGAFLTQAGVRIWDLGMPLGYKLALGGVPLPRSRFLPLFEGSYVDGAGVKRNSLLEASEVVAARGLIDGRLHSPRS